MKILDLFSGIGGFSLAAHWMGWQTTAFVEKDEFCQKVLRKNFGQDIEIYDDITTFSGKPFRGRCDIVTGGFPCQPFSQAGKREGENDERHLFPEMLRVVDEIRPAWVVAENVRGLLSIGNGTVFEEVCSQLEGIGYAVQTFCIPACAVDAPHRRDRLWIIANLQSDGIQKSERQNGQSNRSEFIQSGMDIERKDRDFASDSEGMGRGNGTAENVGQTEREINSSCNQTSRINGNASDTFCRENHEIGRDCECGRDGVGRQIEAALENDRKTDNNCFSRCGCVASDTASQRRRQNTRTIPKDARQPTVESNANNIIGGQDSNFASDSESFDEKRQFSKRDCAWESQAQAGNGNRCDWSKSWLEAAARFCALDDGLPGGLVRPKGWRVNALKAAGNSIVPMIVYEIFKAIEYAETQIEHAPDGFEKFGGNVKPS